MTRVHRIRGVAGAGKTTRMLELVGQFRDEQGYSASDFRWVSFSRSHAKELERDVKKAWEDRTRQLDDDEASAIENTLMANVSTLHSLCVGLTNTPRIVTPETDAEFYEAFWHARGLDFDVEEDASAITDPDDVDGEMSRAAKLLAADQLLAHLGAGLEGEGVNLEASALGRIPIEIDLRASRIIALLEEWRQYKLENDAKEHHDYIIDAANSEKTPNCDVLMVDEMQDYSPLEYAVVRDWIRSGDLDHAVLAGDEHQSIYAFKLADPSYFTGRDVDEEEVLTESYRCPRQICDLARRICPESNISAATDDEGRVADVEIPSADALGETVQQLLDEHPADAYNADSSLFVLCRTNRQAAKVGWGLRQAGVPYTPTDSDGGPWTEDVLEAIEVLRSVSPDYGAVPFDVAETLIEMAPNSDERRQAAEPASFGGLDTTGTAAIDIWTAFPNCDSKAEIVRTLEIDEYVREMVRGALQSDADLDPTRVEVGTIHSVKGREAPAVIVMDGYPHRLANEYDDEAAFRAEEDRLAYVAATRASETLVVGREFLGGETFPPLAPPLDTESSINGVIADD